MLQQQPEIPEAIYYTGLGSTCGTYDRPSPARQVREALRRCRANGLPWPHAWDCAIRHIAYPHEGSVRDDWKVVLSDPQVQEVFRCAYLRLEYRAIDAIGHMKATFEEADVRSARVRHDADRHAA
jgi:hypothetical protein